MIRHAKINDAPVIQQIINQYATKGQMLQISRNEIYEKICSTTAKERISAVSLHVGCNAQTPLMASLSSQIINS